MICADTSVLIPAIGEWHVRHRLANEALTGTIIAVGHCIIEAYAVLTRMPEPFRMAPAIAAVTLTELVDEVIGLEASMTHGLPGRLHAARVQGGATYDGLIALTAAHHGATILTLDERAALTYRACGATFKLIAEKGRTARRDRP